MIVSGMDKFSVLVFAACVLAMAVPASILVAFVGAWISFGGDPWERFYLVLEWAAALRR